MKPQCKTTADCLEQLARVMREFGFVRITEALCSEYILFEDEIYGNGRVAFDDPHKWSFAIAKLEDKPVFIGDTTFSTVSGRKYTAVMSSDKSYWWLNDLCEFQHPIADTSHLSWTPPKQTVSLKVGDNEPVEVEKAWLCVEHLTSGGDGIYVTEYHHETREAAEQFRKAMKPLVKE